MKEVRVSPMDKLITFDLKGYKIFNYGIYNIAGNTGVKQLQLAH